ncbi:MAG: hypothetical protein GTO02_03760 [Candidatus Dadabacteria bacterium]|nr:hypothetical protein [Candidatus Dadabacteria bacterium]NIQ13542.1 hypothetical protein [Candidatus Dadabacteria bacterium]
MNKNKYFLFGALLFLSITIISCGSRRTYEVIPPNKNIAFYTFLEIPDFKASIKTAPTDILWSLPNQIKKKLDKEKIFVGISRAPLDVSESVLIFEGDIVDLTPIEWYKQIVKSAKVSVNVKLIDKATGEVIGNPIFEGTAKWGILGGTRILADLRLVEEIVEYLKERHGEIKNQ